MKLTNFFEGHPEIKNLKVVLTDLNGVFRGKKIPISQIYKIENGNFRMPFSVMNLDIWGNDIEKSKWVFSTGDADGKCFCDSGSRGAGVYFFAKRFGRGKKIRNQFSVNW